MQSDITTAKFLRLFEAKHRQDYRNISHSLLWAAGLITQIPMPTDVRGELTSSTREFAIPTPGINRTPGVCVSVSGISPPGTVGICKHAVGLPRD
jgi:hypothetical protein